MALPKNYRTPSVPPPLFGRRSSVSVVPSGHHHHKGSHHVNPFIQGQPGHPAFAAARFARLAESHDSGKAPIKAPKPPLQPYMRYSKKMWDHVKAANPRIKSIPDIGKMIGKMWTDLTDDERKEYEVEYELDKVAYQEALQNYQNSSAYQEWLKKEEMRKLQLAQEAEDKKTFSSRVGVVQADDDEDNVFSLKHLASARYSRNHLFMADIFSDSIVPDMRQVVFGSKLTRLRGQRETLDETLGKRKEEVQVAEEKHGKVRKKILEDRERWDVSWTEACAKKPKLTEELFETLVQRSRQELREKMRQQQQQLLEQQQQAQKANDNTTAPVKPGTASTSQPEGAVAAAPHNESGHAETVEPSRVEVVNVAEGSQEAIASSLAETHGPEEAKTTTSMECLGTQKSAQGESKTNSSVTPGQAPIADISHGATTGPTSEAPAQIGHIGVSGVQEEDGDLEGDEEDDEDDDMMDEEDEDAEMTGEFGEESAPPQVNATATISGEASEEKTA